jgi:thiol-disulfide isomerase/thioredoxin
MEPTKFTCPHCRAGLKTSQQVLPGQSITCPKCGGQFRTDAVAPKGAPTVEAGSPTRTFTGDVEPPRGEESGRVPRPSRPTERRSHALLWVGVVLVSLLVVGGAVAGLVVWVGSLLETRETPVAEAPVRPPVMPKVIVAPNPAPKSAPLPPDAGEDDDDEGDEPRREPKFPDGTPWVGLGVGNRALEIDGEDLDGKRFKLSDYRGKVVLVDFWADWCVYCRQLYDHEKRLVQRLADKPFVLLGVNCDAKKSQAKRAVQQHGLNWRSWWDGRTTGMPICAQWNVDGYPKMFILDHQGVVRHRVNGMPQSVETLDRNIDTLVAAAEKEASPGAAKPAERAP